MSAALVLNPPVSGVSIAVSGPIEDRKRALLSSAKAIAVVEDGLTQELAADAVKDMKQLLAAVEDSRVAVKAPVLTLGRAIDDAAKRFRVELDAEVSRLVGSITAFQVAERRKAEEAERQRLEELRRIEQARLEAERAEQRKRDEAERAEAARRKAEEDAYASYGAEDSSLPSASEAEVVRKAREAARAQEAAEAERKRQAELAAQEDAIRSAVTRAPTLAAGMKVREEWTFEVTNLYDLALKRNDLVRMEPNVAAINRAIAGGMRECPGLRIYQKVGVRV